MTFQPNIPQPSDLISVSQNDILQNFQSIDTAWNVNHEDFNAVSAGKHIKLELTNQSPAPAGSASQFLLFSQTSSGQSETWYRRNAEGTAYQLTGKNPTTSTKGSTFLPGGLLMQWDFLTGASKNDGAVISFLNTFSATPYSIQLTASRNGTSTNVLNATSVSSSGFTLRTSSNSNDGVWYLAIGKA